MDLGFSFSIFHPPFSILVALAGAGGVGGVGGGLDFYFRGEFFHARFRAATGGKIRAALAGGDRGTAQAAAVFCGTHRPARDARRRPAPDFHAQTTRRAGGDFGGMNLNRRHSRGATREISQTRSVWPQGKRIRPERTREMYESD